MAQEISNSDDIIDSRDVIARIEELESELETLTEAVDDTSGEVDETLQALDAAEGEDEIAEARENHEKALEAHADANSELTDWDGAEELKILKAFADEGEASPDWQHGETCIREDYFTEYAQELAEECCEVPAERRWPFTCIDWEQAARELKMDFTTAEFDGVTYYLRA